MEHEKNNQLLVGKLKEISKALGKYYSVKIGILAENNKPISPNMDLAGIGAVQEYGAKIQVTDKMRAYFRHTFGVNLRKSTTEINIPARSWLYEPIKSPEFKKLIYDYVGDIELLKEYGDKDIMKDLAKIIGEAGLFQIQKAFETSGNGQWAPNSAITIRQKGSSKPLIDTGRLRGSITYEVENA
jgi:hypothetical protein